MVSYIKSVFNYFFANKSIDEDDEERDQYLVEQILQLQLNAAESDEETYTPTPEVPQRTVCYERTGVITYMAESHVLIDGMISYDSSDCSLNLHVDDKVTYLGYKDKNDTFVVVRIVQNHGMFWGNEDDAFEENSFNVIDHVFVGEVETREQRTVYVKYVNSMLNFDLDNVTATFIPIQGDWLEILCKVKFDPDNPMDISFNRVIEVVSFKALRSKVKSSVITSWSGDCGICDKNIYFDKHCVVKGGQPSVGSKVFIEAIESDQGVCLWRAIKMEITESNITSTIEENALDNTENTSFQVEKAQNIEVTYPLKFDNVTFQDNTSSIPLNIKNNSDQVIVLNKWIMLCKKRDSQVNISPFIKIPQKILPGHTFNMSVSCHPKFYGRTKEHLIIMFRGFKVERMIELNVVGNTASNMNINTDNTNYISANHKIEMLKQMRRNNNTSFVPGVRPIRPANFIAIKLGAYLIPDKVWNAVLGDSKETICNDFEKSLSRIENNMPCLIQPLNIHNYRDRWHTLLYMEEIQLTIAMRAYDMPKVFLDKYQEYLGVEIKGLAERRPSLIVGDRVVVKDIWDANMPSYEGYIHQIIGEKILIKFHSSFHECYSGSDVSIEFHFSRTTFRRAHQAVNLAYSQLGVDVLFPSRIHIRPPQIPHEEIKKIKWFNENLNNGQRSAVTNILLGECRPMPYCIYGPPGTGKTITVIETILQILKTIPESRILVATPSNSAANLVAERLVAYEELFPSALVRLIAHHMVDSETIPDVIKKYCATINLAREESVKSTWEVRDGVNLNVSASHISRHRVCIATCYSLGGLAQLGLPQGHFTHVIVDEAGQALEPEIMIPLTFINKDHGQIILAGDPLQLGPVVLSKYNLEFGYNESYMSRILETFPYQRDFKSFEQGFNEKLVTRLCENYRSLDEVIALPSAMFYDSSLIAKIDRNLPWVGKILEVISDLFETTEDPKKGGIFVHGVRGYNTRAEDSPSWFNPHEASMVALTVCKLIKKNISADDIGVITPYVAQIRYIRLLFDGMGLPQPKIGTVEEFQGQERPIVIISTVRTSESHIYVDQKHALGFVKNPKRLNVALTRAQVAAILFCDPHLLLRDPLWEKVVNHAITNDKYVGCDLPTTCIKLKKELNLE